MLILLLFSWFGKLSAEGTECEIPERCFLLCRYNATLELGYPTHCKHLKEIEFQYTDIDTDKFKNLKSYSFEYLDLKSINNIQDVRHAIKGFNIQKLRIYDHNIKELKADMFNESGPFNLISLALNNIEVLQQKSIPKGKWVFLNHNFIKTLTADMFTDISYVQYLILRDNHIKKITASSLLGLKAVNLDLSYNHVESLENSSIPEVENVYLNHNKLKSIHSPMFVHILNTNILDVSYNNITNFNFKNSEFDVLNMSHNKITRISQNSFSGMKILGTISLSNNLIESLEMKSIPLVKNLNLSYNLLTSIEENMLSDKDHLNYLDIRNNCIEQIDFKFIKHVYISLGIFNERCKFYGLTKTDIFFISKSTVYIVGTFVLVAVFVAIAMIILYSRRFTKSTKNDEMSMVVFNDLSNAVSDDNNRRLVEPPHEYEAINYIVPERRESNGYLVPRSDL